MSIWNLGICDLAVRGSPALAGKGEVQDNFWCLVPGGRESFSVLRGSLCWSLPLSGPQHLHL